MQEVITTIEILSEVISKLRVEKAQLSKRIEDLTIEVEKAKVVKVK